MIADNISPDVMSKTTVVQLIQLYNQLEGRLNKIDLEAVQRLQAQIDETRQDIDNLDNLLKALETTTQGQIDGLLVKITDGISALENELKDLQENTEGSIDILDNKISDIVREIGQIWVSIGGTGFTKLDSRDVAVIDNPVNAWRNEAGQPVDTVNDALSVIADKFVNVSPVDRADTAGHADTATRASLADHANTAGRASTASLADTAIRAHTAGRADFAIGASNVVAGSYMFKQEPLENEGVLELDEAVRVAGISLSNLSTNLSYPIGSYVQVLTGTNNILVNGLITVRLNGNANAQFFVNTGTNNMLHGAWRSCGRNATVGLTNTFTLARRIA